MNTNRQIRAFLIDPFCSGPQIRSISLHLSNINDPVFLFMDRKRAEGKHYYVYMVADVAKLLRI